MTREEAIKHGKEQLEVFGGTHREFIEMAIKALEQEPCEDVISRKDALEPYRVLKDTDTLCVALIRANIMQQPSVKQDTVPFDIELYQAGLMDMPKEMIDVFDKIRAEIHATAEMHEDGNYYLRDEWIDEIIDKYKAESEG